MDKYVFIGILCLDIFVYQVLSQCLRPSPYNIVPRQIPEYIDAPRIIEAPRFIETPRIIDASRMLGPSTISELPSNSIVPIPNVPPTTIITDCSPAVCKNLANTIQLMIVCNLLQNTKGGTDIAMQLAAPILNDVLTSPSLSCGCANPVSPNIASPYISPNFISTNMAAPNLVSTNMASPNLVSANMISPRVISSNVISPNIISGCPNAPISNIQSTSGLLSSLMNLLGSGIQM